LEVIMNVTVNMLVRAANRVANAGVKLSTLVREVLEHPEAYPDGLNTHILPAAQVCYEQGGSQDPALKALRTQLLAIQKNLKVEEPVTFDTKSDDGKVKFAPKGASRGGNAGKDKNQVAVDDLDAALAALVEKHGLDTVLERLAVMDEKPKLKVVNG
jgi:hypothetical protein